MVVNDMKAGPAAVDLVAEMEGFRAQAYLCPAGVWTIGYGHTADVVKNMVISQAIARQLLESDLQQAASAVRAAVSVKLSPVAITSGIACHSDSRAWPDAMRCSLISTDSPLW